MSRHQLDILLTRASRLADYCGLMLSNSNCQSLQRSILESIEFCKNEKQRKPLIISLIGGTGVGKSFIFSTLAGTPGASPSSASVRGFTSRPCVSAHEKDRPFLPFSEKEADYLPGFLQDAVIIDTPDLDTINDNNARLARETIAVSDIIITVTTPDKRSDFSIQQNILNWASRKRWFFVMNKMDLVEDVPIDLIRNDFTRRLNGLGFQPDNSVLFFFSARKNDSPDFIRFKNAITANHTVAQSQFLHQEASIRQLLHTINSEEFSKLHLLLGQLRNNRELLGFRMLEAEKQILESNAIEAIAADALLQNMYSAIGNRLTLFLFPYFLVLRKFSSADSLVSIEPTIKKCFHHSELVRSCFTDETRFLEDHDLQSEPDTTNHQQYCHEATRSICLQINNAGKQIVNTRLIGFYLLVGNLLPAVILLQALYRSISSWIYGIWLPSDFFIHAVFLIIGASVPGYLLISNGMQRLSKSLHLRASDDQDQQFSQLTGAISSLEKLLHEASLLSSESNASLADLKKQLPRSTYGLEQTGSVD